MSKNKFKITKKILAKEENQVDSRLYEIISKNIQIRMLSDDRSGLFRMLLQLQTQLDQQKAMWNELKEHISNQIIHYDELSDKFKEENNNGCVLLANSKRNMIEEILFKMQELEKGEKDDNC